MIYMEVCKSASKTCISPSNKIDINTYKQTLWDLTKWSNQGEISKTYQLLSNWASNLIFGKRNCKSNQLVKLELKLNTTLGLQTHPPHPPHHKLFEGF